MLKITYKHKWPFSCINYDETFKWYNNWRASTHHQELLWRALSRNDGLSVARTSEMKQRVCFLRAGCVHILHHNRLHSKWSQTKTFRYIFPSAKIENSLSASTFSTIDFYAFHHDSSIGAQLGGEWSENTSMSLEPDKDLLVVRKIRRFSGEGQM